MINIINGWVCGGTNCSVRENCKYYIGNSHEGLFQYLDYSNTGSVSTFTTGNGEYIYDDRWDCGNNSENYRYFAPLEDYIAGMEEYIQDLKNLGKSDPEEARRQAKESLIRSGILNEDGSLKEHICNRDGEILT